MQQKEIETDPIGYVYVLTNPSIEYVKIGSTQRTPDERAKELSADTGVPIQYVVTYGVLCHEPTAIERVVHKRLASSRVNPNREFFSVSVQESVETIEDVAGSRIIEVGHWCEDWSRSVVQQKKQEDAEALMEAKRIRQEENAIADAKVVSEKQRLDRERQALVDAEEREARILYNTLNPEWKDWQIDGFLKLITFQVGKKQLYNPNVKEDIDFELNVSKVYYSLLEILKKNPGKIIHTYDVIALCARKKHKILTFDKPLAWWDCVYGYRVISDDRGIGVIPLCGFTHARLFPFSQEAAVSSHLAREGNAFIKYLKKERPDLYEKLRDYGWCL